MEIYNSEGSVNYSSKESFEDIRFSNDGDEYFEELYADAMREELEYELENYLEV